MTIDFEKGEVFIIDKPYEWTSTDVVRKLKNAIRKKTGIAKFKIGHAGTLDPLATGILIVCVGKKTKEIEKFQAERKEYTGIITIGATTPSCDLETPIEQTFDIRDITEEKIKSAVLSLEGEQMQTAPLYSAKKIDGQRAYELARKGDIKEVKSHAVTIFRFEITEVKLPDVYFRVECSKGTYIRTLASDLGKKLNNGAYLRALRRTANGDFKVEQAVLLENLLKELSVDGQPVEVLSSRKFRRTE